MKGGRCGVSLHEGHFKYRLNGAKRVVAVGPLEREYGVQTVVKHDRDRPKGEFRPLRPLWRVEAVFSGLGRWRRLARSFEGTLASATAWMQVAAVGALLRQARRAAGIE